MSDAKVGIGGAPTRATTLPEDAAERKKYPVVSGLFDYFPDALVAVANLSYRGNEQHNPGQPLHWARGKSTDHTDTLGRHLLQRGTIDTDGVSHTVKVAWRALAMLQEEIEGWKPSKCMLKAETVEKKYGLPDGTITSMVPVEQVESWDEELPEKWNP